MTSPLVPKSDDTAETVRMKFIAQSLESINCNIKEMAGKLEALESTYIKGHVTLESTVREIQNAMTKHELDNHESISELEIKVNLLRSQVDELLGMKKMVYWVGGALLTADLGIIVGIVTHTIHIP